MRKCKKCGQLREYILVPKVDNDRRFYIDEKGEKWKGSVCPTCYRTHHREYQQGRSEAKPTYDIICPICLTLFHQKVSTQKYCSSICQEKAKK